MADPGDDGSRSMLQEGLGSVQSGSWSPLM